MAAAPAPPSGGSVHFAIPEGTVSITQANPVIITGEGRDSWREGGDKQEVTSVTILTSMTSIGSLLSTDAAR